MGEVNLDRVDSLLDALRESQARYMNDPEFFHRVNSAVVFCTPRTYDEEADEALRDAATASAAFVLILAERNL